MYFFREFFLPEPKYAIRRETKCFDFGGDLEQDTRFSVYFSPFEGSKKQFIISWHRMYRASHRYGLLLQMAWCGLCAGHDRKAVQKRLAAGYAFWGRLAWAPVH